MRVKKTAVAFVVIVKTHKAVVIKEKVLMSGCIFLRVRYVAGYICHKKSLAASLYSYTSTCLSEKAVDRYMASVNRLQAVIWASVLKTKHKTDVSLMQNKGTITHSFYINVVMNSLKKVKVLRKNKLTTNYNTSIYHNGSIMNSHS